MAGGNGKQARRGKRRDPVDEKPALELLQQQIEFAILGKAIPPCVNEWQFDSSRKWKFDYAWPTYNIAMEFEGGTFINGAHTRGAHYESDCIKYSEAAILGWCVIRVTAAMVREGIAITLLIKALESRGFELDG